MGVFWFGLFLVIVLVAVVEVHDRNKQAGEG